MPISVPNTAAITAAVQAMLNSQKTALDATINTARDVVNNATIAKGDDVIGHVAAKATQVNTNTNSARDVINTHVTSKATEVSTAVNTKGVVKSVQRGIASPDPAVDSALGTMLVTVAAVDGAKSVLTLAGTTGGPTGTITSHSGRIISSTQLEIKGWRYSGGQLNAISWQLTEYF